MKNTNKGFTLIELLIVIAIIAILAAAVFVVLDPLTRFQDTRDSTRASDVTQILSAVKLYQVDNGGSFISEIDSLATNTVSMIGTDSTGCDDNNLSCDTAVDSDTACVDLSGLVTAGYLAQVPISPEGAVAWDEGITGYTIEKSAQNVITIRSCESENTDEIFSGR